MSRAVLAVLLGALFAGAVAAAEGPAPILGDYDAEPRLADGHVDCRLLLQRLQDLHANTYFWLIWHKPTDWEDLQRFLPMAQEAGIRVWAYLVPYTESGFGGLYSEPFRTDFVRWSREIACLSLQYPNLAGYVIDDFGANMGPGRFSAQAIREFVRAGKQLNPALRFYPLMYYRELNRRTVTLLADTVDGVVAAYPADAADLRRAAALLSDDLDEPGGCWTVYPPDTPSTPGDYSALSQQCRVLNANTASISFRLQDDFDGPTEGYHVMQLRVDGQTVWAEDVAGRDEKTVLLNLRDYLGVKPQVKITLGVWDLKGVSQFPVRVLFSELRLSGLQMEAADLGEASGWLLEHRGAFQMECRQERKAQHAYRLPLIAMPAGSRAEYARRYGDGATTEHIAARVREAVYLARKGTLEGVVIYCLDKTPQSPDLPALAPIFERAAAGNGRP